MKHGILHGILKVCGLVAICMNASHAIEPGTQGAAARPEDTEQWEPVPRIVAPGAQDGAAPADAIVLFDGTNLDQWVMSKDHSPARWRIADGSLVVDKAFGNIETKRLFRNYQLHLEWRIPANISGEGQARGNSGLFLASTGPENEGYEIQILDSWENRTYVNGQAASIYKQSPPLVNASRQPGQWQSYDVVWKAPVFHADGAVETPGFVTVFHNGVLVQNHFCVLGETVYIGGPTYRNYDRAAIKLQAHRDPSLPISFRNIWVRELDKADGTYSGARGSSGVGAISSHVGP